MLDSHCYFLQSCSCHLLLAPMVCFEEAGSAGPCRVSRDLGVEKTVRGALVPSHRGLGSSPTSTKDISLLAELLLSKS